MQRRPKTVPDTHLRLLLTLLNIHKIQHAERCVYSRTLVQSLYIEQQWRVKRHCEQQNACLCYH